MKNLGLLLICTLLFGYAQGEIFTSSKLNSKQINEESFQPIKKTKKKRKKRRQAKAVENEALDNKISISEENQPTTKKKRK